MSSLASPQPAFVVIDDANPGIHYNGPWKQFNGDQLQLANVTEISGPPFQNTLHGTSDTANFTFAFSGSAIRVYGTFIVTQGIEAPTWECFIDNLLNSNASVPNPSLPNPSFPNHSIPNPSIPNLSISNPSTPIPGIPIPSILNPITPIPSTPISSIPISSIPNPSILDPSILDPSTPIPSILNPSIPILNAPIPSTPIPSILNPSVPIPSILNPSVPIPSILNPSIPIPSILNPSISNPSISLPVNGAPQSSENNWGLCYGHFADGNHTLTVVAHVSNQQYPYLQNFYVDRIEYDPSASVSLNQSLMRIDSSDPAVKYSSFGWVGTNETNNVTQYSGTTHTTWTNGTWFTLDFSGTSISLFGLQNNISPYAIYAVDNHSAAHFPLTNDSSTNSTTGMLFEAKGLTPGPHTLSVAYIGNGTTPLSISYFLSQNGSGPGRVGSSSTTIHRKPIIGGVIGLLLISLFLNVLQIQML